MDFISYIAGEARVIAQAPATFIIMAIVLGLMMYFIVRHQFTDRIASMEGRLELRNDRITDYEAKLQGRSPDEAAAVIEDLKRRLAALEPRSLTPEETKTLLGVLSAHSFAVEIAHDGASAISKKLHSQLAAIFHQCGWSVGTPMVMGVGNPPRSGIAVIGDPNDEAVITVADALRSAGVHHDLQPRQRPQSLSKWREEAPVEIVVTTPAD